MDPPDPEAIDALARDLLEDLSPDELPLFPVTRDAYWQRGGLPRQSGGSGGLDFDAGTGIALALAPIALAVANFALRLLTDILRQIASETAKQVAATLLVRLRGAGGAAAAALPKLPEAEYRRLRDGIAAEARRYLSETSAQRLTDAVLTRIAEREEAPG